MKILHRISINSVKDAELMSVVTKFNIDHTAIASPSGGSQLVTFVIEETNDRWPVISRLVSIRGAVDLAETFFSDEEIRTAEWLRLISTFEQGYPQPKMDWPLKQSSRELLCAKCVTYKQIAPMRVAKEPHMGKKSFMSLIWENEIFCTPEVFRGLEEIQAKGYEEWDVLIHKTGQISEKVRQLFIPAIAGLGVLVEDDLNRTTCPTCGTTKYYPHVKGAMRIKREALIPDTDFLLTNEWFGHGLLAWREILISSRIAKLILDKKWSGVRFKVVDVV
ncbi:MAG TPA: hypothetical protein DCP32_04370 [Anaerolineaceae bacterium]|nr:MAG: hypothetical protein A2X24_03355 [Chloroflexi bacterium GWB2_54_36]HAL16000.1 hypothetical protein [Anaerolineaceae bacterium]HBA92109.1 hypothetical protein [Anaerolineaceae bacterium]